VLLDSSAQFSAPFPLRDSLAAGDQRMAELEMEPCSGLPPDATKKKSSSFTSTTWRMLTVLTRNTADWAITVDDVVSRLVKQ